MKYVKHLTLKEWNRFNKTHISEIEAKYAIPMFDYSYNHYDNLDKRHEMLKKIGPCCIDEKKNWTICENCKKYDEVEKKYPPTLQELETVTGQEIMLSRYEIILDGYEPKYTRIYHKITSVINMTNFDKGMKIFDNSMKAFSKGVGESGKIDRQNRKNLETINGKSKKSLGSLLWNDIKKDGVSLWGVAKDQTKSKKKRRRAPGVDEQFWGNEKKKDGRSVDDQVWGTRKKSGKRSKSVKEAVWGNSSKVKLM